MPTNAQREIREARGGPEASCWGQGALRAERVGRAGAISVANRMSRNKQPENHHLPLPA